MNNNLYATNIKTILIDHLLKQPYKNLFIGTEVPYLSGKRWADLLALQDDATYFYEIKSDFDSLKKLSGQIKDSCKTFDFSNVVVSEKYSRNISKFIPKSVGILEVSSSTRKIKIIRIAKRRKKLTKLNLSYFIWRDEILQILGGKGRKALKNLDTHQLRLKLKISFDLPQIKKFAMGALKNRYEYRFKNFLQERGDRTLVQDLDILTSKQDTI